MQWWVPRAYPKLPSLDEGRLQTGRLQYVMLLIKAESGSENYKPFCWRGCYMVANEK